MVDIAAPAGKMIKISGDPLSVLNSINSTPRHPTRHPTESAHMSRVSQEEINSARKNTQPTEVKNKEASKPSQKSDVGILTLPTHDSLSAIMAEKAA